MKWSSINFTQRFFCLKLSFKKNRSLLLLLQLEKLAEKITYNNYIWMKEWETWDALSMEDFIIENVGNLIFREMIRHVVRTSCGKAVLNFHSQKYPNIFQ